jgi:HlyD family secretion protein
VLPRISRVLVAAPVLLLVLTAASCDSGPDGVSVGAVGRGTVDEIVEASGSVTARAAATLSSPADGTVESLRVEAGQHVSKGDVVAVIDAPDVEARERSAARALDEADRGGGVSVGGTAGFTAARKRTDAQATSAFDDARTAAAKISDPTLRAALLKQVDAAQKQYSAASEAAGEALRSVQRGVASLGQAVGALSSAQRLQAQQAYDLASAAVDALTLHAPVSGVVQLGGPSAASSSSLSSLLSSGGSSLPTAAAGGSTLPGVDTAVPTGAYVAAGTPLMTIVDTAKLGLSAEVDETDVLLVKPGVTASVEFDAVTGATYRATVQSVDVLPTTSATGGVSYRVRLDLGKGADAEGGAAPTPRPGMSAVVRLQVRQATDAVTVPVSAVISADGHDTVWAVRDGHYQQVPVTLGVQGEDVVQVTGGVQEGQRIVVSGADRVHQGDKAS